jgi:HlyD family secretion protein
MKKVLIVLVLLIVIGAAGAYLTMGGGDVEAQYFSSAVERGTIQNTVAATGNVEAVVNVQVGSQVTGQIQSLYADFNSVVTRGMLLAKLDPRNLETQLANTRANLVSARARIRTAEADLTNSRAGVASSEANLVSARVDLEKSEIDLRRAQELFEAGLIPMSELESAETSVESVRARLVQTEAAVQQSEAQIISREAGLEQAQAQLVQAEAQLLEAEVNLSYTDISSPIDGVVISREVDVGQTVSASTSAPTLFQIANDLTRMRVQASIDEADIGLLAQNNEVEFNVDAYPTERFRGEIEEIRLVPSTTQNVVTYSVIVGVDNPELKLKPGMTANITITVDRRDNALHVANTALRYSPPDVDPDAIEQTRGTTATPAAADSEGGSEEAAADIAAPPQPGQFGGRGGRGGGRGGFGGGGFPEGFRERFEGFGGRGGGRGQGGNAAGAASSTVVAAASGDSLNALPGQLWSTGEKIQFQSAPPQPPRPGRLWVLTATGEIEMRDLMLGITDGSRSEVVSGDLVEGDQVLIGDSTQLAEIDNGGDNNTRNMFRMMRGGGR